MIITRLYGGLGNQMFQYAAGLALAHLRRSVVKLDVSCFNEYNFKLAHERYALGCFNIIEQFSTQAELDPYGRPPRKMSRMISGLARRAGLGEIVHLLPPAGMTHIPSNIAFYSDFFDLPDGTLLYGLFQSEKFFEPVANILRCHFSFRYPPLPAVAEMADRIGRGPSVAVHFRRGDYVFNKLLGVIGFDYYERAIGQIRAVSPDSTLYIFSDDIDFIEREFRPSGPHVFVKVTQPWHSYDKIRLMSLCNHFVIANSTFSWWAAWMGSFPGKIVIAPTPWLDDPDHDDKDIIPSHWTRLGRN